MRNYVTRTRDQIVLDVIEKIDNRSVMGNDKYGGTMMKEIENGEKDLKDFIIDVQEELMDALLYLESAKHCLNDAIQDAALRMVAE